MRISDWSSDVCSSDLLLPVRLRGGDRVLGGALTWDTPARLAPFADDSPFADITLPGDVMIRRQVLAEPSLDLGEKSWARLSDGTPLVTADRRGRSEEHTSELQSLMRTSYAVFGLKQ